MTDPIDTVKEREWLDVTIGHEKDFAGQYPALIDRLLNEIDRMREDYMLVMDYFDAKDAEIRHLREVLSEIQKASYRLGKALQGRIETPTVSEAYRCADMAKEALKPND